MLRGRRAADLEAAIKRLEKVKRPPRWLLEQLKRTAGKAESVHPEMARWRNSAPDAPAYAGKQ